MPKVFRKFLWISAAIHLCAFLIILFSPQFSKILPEKKNKVTWVRLTKGTGKEPSLSPFKKSKGMPYSTIREQKDALKEPARDKKGTDVKSLESTVKTIETPPPTQQKTSPQGGIDFSRKDSRERTIEDALARVQEQLEKREVEIEAAQIEKEGQGQSPYGSLDIPEGEANPVLAAYFEAVKRKINQEWITTPKQLSEGQTLKTVVNLRIDLNGNIISNMFETQSGDASFDLSAMRAIERAAPFPSPPDEIRAEVLSEGFLIEFNPRSVVGNL